MSKYDLRHIAYHVLVALYFIWLPVLGVLLAMSLTNTFNTENYRLEKVFMMWIFLNMLMGTAMFIVLQLFKNKGLLNNIIRFTYLTMAIAALTTVVLIIYKK